MSTKLRTMLAPPTRDLDRLEQLIVDLGRLAARRESHPLETDLPVAKRLREYVGVLVRMRGTVGSGRLSRRHLRETLAHAEALLAEQTRSLVAARTEPRPPFAVDASSRATIPEQRTAREAMAERARRELDDD